MQRQNAWGKKLSAWTWYGEGAKASRGPAVRMEARIFCREQLVTRDPLISRYDVEVLAG